MVENSQIEKLTQTPGDLRKTQRVLRVKCVIDWKDEEDQKLYKRLRDLSWQCARYKNGLIRRTWATLVGFRHASAPGQANAMRNEWRKEGRGELGSNVIDAAGREVEGAWKRDGKRMLAGSPLAEWKPGESLSVRCRKQGNSIQGVKLELVNGQYIANVQLQSDKCADGAWIRIPVSKGTEKDWHAPILNKMISWEIPIKKASITLGRHDSRLAIVLHLTYEIEIPLPVMGARVAVLGPIRDGRLLLRTETQTKDYSSKLADLLKHKDDWDLIRRRATRQIGWRKGHARTKRNTLSRLSWDTWLKNHIETWTRETVEWCKKQGVGEIRVEHLNTGDWPAFQFEERLHQKAAEHGITVKESDILDESAGGQRALKQIVTKHARDAKQRADALRELKDQTTKRRKLA